MDQFETFLAETGNAVDALLNAKDAAPQVAAELSAIIERIHALQNATVPGFAELIVTAPAYQVIRVKDCNVWFVVRLSDGAWMARCKSEVAAIASMQRRIAKDAAKLGEVR